MLGEAGPDGALAEAVGGKWAVLGADEACKPRLDPMRGSEEVCCEDVEPSWERGATECSIRRLGEVGRLMRDGGSSGSHWVAKERQKRILTQNKPSDNLF